MEYSKEYYRILQRSKYWPKWKIDIYNKCVSFSAHAKKLKEKSK